MRGWPVAGFLLGVIFLPGPVRAQTLSGDGGVFVSSTTRRTWRIGFSSEFLGPTQLRLYGTRLWNSGGPNLYGLGGDLTVFEGGRPGPYLVGGIGGGVAGNASGNWWSSWSAGAGYEVVPFRGLALRGEGRYRVLNPDHHTGLEFTLGAAFNFGSGRAPNQPSYTVERHGAAPASGKVVSLAESKGFKGDKAELVAQVVQTASDAMGTPYQWGGTGKDGSGFDCSGLIQWAYGQHGVRLPRVSRDQAREGKEIPKRLDALAPGDILTFSNSGTFITHVALYVGDGKFIHSANGGVQLSVLSPDDSYGRWWWKRWVGVRRIVN
ncbi:MAG: C40 family peptidase [Gemmatimonadales bacterium]